MHLSALHGSRQDLTGVTGHGTTVCSACERWAVKQ